MADTTKIQVNGNENWNLKVTQSGTATLATAGKYVDRNITVEVPEAVYSISPVGTPDLDGIKDPLVASAISETVENSITQIAVDDPEQRGDKYYVIRPTSSLVTNGEVNVAIGGKAQVTQAGFIAENDNIAISGEQVSIGSIEIKTDDEEDPTKNEWYLPVKELSSTDIKGTNGFVKEGEAVKDTFNVSLEIPAGYYEKQTITRDFTDLLPNLDVDAYDETILAGSKAYDDKGNVILGTMTNYGDADASMEATGSSSTITTGSNIVTKAVNTKDESEKVYGLAVTARGTVNVAATIDGPGFYEGSTSNPEAFTSDSKTEYITDIIISGDTVLDSLTVNANGEIGSVSNNGTIDTLSGTGTIDSLEGQQTVNNLKGALTIVNGIDEDSDHTNGNGGSVRFGDELVISDGHLIEGGVTVNEHGELVTTKGWISTSEVLEDAVQTGEYSVSSVSQNPKIKLETSKPDEVITSDITTPYYVEFKTSVESKGSNVATATITQAGWIAADHKDYTDSEIGVDGVGTERVFLAEATFQSKLGAEKYTDNESVSQFYEVDVKSAGYTEANNITQIPVFDGEFSWG